MKTIQTQALKSSYTKVSASYLERCSGRAQLKSRWKRQVHHRLWQLLPSRRSEARSVESGAGAQARHPAGPCSPTHGTAQFEARRVPADSSFGYIQRLQPGPMPPEAAGIPAPRFDSGARKGCHAHNKETMFSSSLRALLLY